MDGYTRVERQKLILIVDDDEAIAHLIKDILNEEPSYHVIVAHNACRALQVVRAMIPDLILLDLKLPRVDGAQLFAILRAEPTTKDIPVFFTTAAPKDPDLARLNINARQVISKPFDIDDLLARVAEVCQ